eukprot:scaffold928_cov370-Prasinococcus_capsulatus_cf.AAC.17
MWIPSSSGTSGGPLLESPHESTCDAGAPGAAVAWGRGGPSAGGLPHEYPHGLTEGTISGNLRTADNQTKTDADSRRSGPARPRPARCECGPPRAGWATAAPLRASSGSGASALNVIVARPAQLGMRWAEAASGRRRACSARRGAGGGRLLLAACPPRPGVDDEMSLAVRGAATSSGLPALQPRDAARSLSQSGEAGAVRCRYLRTSRRARAPHTEAARRHAASARVGWLPASRPPYATKLLRALSCASV